MMKARPHIDRNILEASLGLAMCLWIAGPWHSPVVSVSFPSYAVSDHLCLIAGFLLAILWFSLKPATQNDQRIPAWTIATVSIIIAADQLTNDALGLAPVAGLVALHYCARTLAALFFALWANLLYQRFPDFAVDVFIGMLIAVALLNVLAALLVEQILRWLGICFALLAGFLYVQYERSAVPPENSAEDESKAAPLPADGDAAKPAVRENPKYQLLLFFVAMFCCAFIMFAMNTAWLPYREVTDSAFATHLTYALGVALAAGLLLFFRWQIKLAQGAVLLRCFVLVFVLLVLYLSLFSSGSTASFAYLIPSYIANKLLYVLLFVVAGQAVGTPAGRSRLFAAFFVVYQLAYLANSFMPDEVSRGVITGIAALVVFCEFFLAMYNIFFDYQNTGRNAIQAVRNAGNEEFIRNVKPEEVLQIMLHERYGLTRRETEILFLLADGGTTRSIAEDLVISMDTSKTHIKNIYTKFGVHSKYELMTEFLKLTDGLNKTS